VSETRRDEQKLWLILFQIKGVRSRLNFLAMQRWLFAGIAILIGAVALTFFAAASLGPLTFLGVAIFLLLAAIVGIIRETMLVRAMRTSPARAAAIADTRSPREVAEVIRGLGYEPVWKDWEAALTPGEDEAFPESLRAEACF